MAFIFEMPHILMSIVLYYTIIVLYISSTFDFNSYIPQFATSYVSRMQKNMISFVFSWWIVVSKNEMKL